MDSLQANNLSNSSNATIVEFNSNAFCSCSFLFSISILCIYIGSIRSVRKKTPNEEKSIEQITTKDAVIFPFIASAGLFSIYMAFKFLPIIYINYVVKGHFTFIGIIAMARLFSPFFYSFFPASIKNCCYKLTYTSSQESGDTSSKKWDILGLFVFTNDNPDHSEFSVETKDFIGVTIAVALGVWYFATGHWIANNFIGVTIAILGIEYIQLQKFKNAVLLLSGLFLYDIFWVFGTPVMLTVAKNLDAPIKKFSLLGLGDIVVPGLLIAMLLRFDKSLNRQGSRLYFYSGYFAYCLALLFTFVMMYIFKHAQPALLYLVPACLGLPLAMVIMNGDLEVILNYEDQNFEKSNTPAEDQQKKVK